MKASERDIELTLISNDFTLATHQAQGLDVDPVPLRSKTVYGYSNPFSLTAFPGIGSPVAELGVIAYLRLHDEIGSDIASNSTIILNGSKDRYQVTGAGKIEYLDADPRTLSVRGTGSS